MSAAALSWQRRGPVVMSSATTATQPASPTTSHIPRPQSASGRYKPIVIPSDTFYIGNSNNNTTTTTATSSITTPVNSEIDSTDKGQVRVVLRLRPSDPDDPGIPPRHRTVLVHPTSLSEVRVRVDPATLAGGVSSAATAAASSSKRHPTFTFDRVLSESASQVDLYNATAKDRIEEFLRGFNVTFLAYGQTSSGKSYSMGTTGEDADYDEHYQNPRTGLIPRTVETIFRRAEEIRLASGPGAHWECRLSFLELYNEDIIDLLIVSGNSVAVSIRENQDGRIVWSGVREVKVSNVAEVMQFLREGSARRRTGETNMNATSSRSHAIFSLTLTQARRRHAGPSNPDESGASGRMLRRPASFMSLTPSSRSSTPAMMRSPPPSSFSSKIGRPNSVLGPLADEMVIVTSKFNMVDLAGSERLKRTAAQGERMKEGISINSGLLTLGNVISALSEPPKNRGHIPYRDSKLTRLLQDSIGGNSLTTMIACISPIEFNISETINTIHYASRARKIRNTVAKNVVEVGWDDIEHLRNTVLKLRADLAAITEGDLPRTPPRKPDMNGHDGVWQRQLGELTQRFDDLQEEFSSLQDQYFQKCHELVALSDPQLDEDDKLRQFNETIEPVVLEYEKVVTSLNAQLTELRAEATASSRLADEQYIQLAQTQEQLTQHESYVQELQGRLSKLAVRSEASEAYIQDLESKYRTFTEDNDQNVANIAILSADIQQMREESAKSNDYISQLEARIAASDLQNSQYSSLIERHVQEAKTNSKTIEDLEGRLALLDNSQDVNLLLQDIELRDSRISTLETHLQQMQNSIEADKEPKTPVTSPVTSPVLRTISEDSDSDLDMLRKRNQQLLSLLRDAELRYQQFQATPHLATPALEPSLEVKTDFDAPSKGESTGNDSSESDHMVLTPKFPSRSSSPIIHGDFAHLSNQLSPVPHYATVRDYRQRAHGEPRLLRPLSLSHGLSALGYSAGSPRYSWTAPNNGQSSSPIPTQFSERIPQVAKRQSMPFDIKLLRSPQSLEIENTLLQKTVGDREAQLRQREIEIKYLKKTLEQGTTIATSSQLGDDVVDRLRDEHADELDKVYALHKGTVVDLEQKHLEALEAVHRQLENNKGQHQAELDDLEATHSLNMSRLLSDHRVELERMSELQSSLDAAWEELAVTGKRHQSELDNLVATHRQTIIDLDSRHNTALDALQKVVSVTSSALDSCRAELQVAIEARSTAETVLATRLDPSTVVSLDEHNFVVSAMEEMENMLTAAEDEKRQLKMKADQVRFELSRIRDEFQLQRSTDRKQMAELENRCSSLTSDNSELKQQLVQDLSKNRDSKQSGVGDSQASRTKLPPIGPPPTAPLPPLPSTTTIFSPAGTVVSLPRTSNHESSQSIYSEQSSPRAVDGLSRREPHYAANQDRLLTERDELLHQLAETSEKMLDIENQLLTEKKNNEQCLRDLIELRKNNSKLKVRVDDVNRELSDLKRERDTLRRDVVEMKRELTDAQYESIADRQRLDGARSEIAQYKAKLDRLVDTKVSKRTDQRIKCF